MLEASPSVFEGGINARKYSLGGTLHSSSIIQAKALHLSGTLLFDGLTICGKERRNTLYMR